MHYIKRFLFPQMPDQTQASWLLLAARIVFGALLMSHGTDKWMSTENASLSFPDPLGIGSMLSFSLVIFAEILCSAGFILGALYRLCLIPMIFTMCMAFFVIHADDPFVIKELAFIYLVVFVLMFLYGPGKFSIDSAIKKAIE